MSTFNQSRILHYSFIDFTLTFFYQTLKQLKVNMNKALKQLLMSQHNTFTNFTFVNLIEFECNVNRKRERSRKMIDKKKLAHKTFDNRKFERFKKVINK